MTSVRPARSCTTRSFVAKAAGTPDAVPNPTGNVVFHRYATIDCTGTPVDQTVALTPGTPSTAISNDFAPTGNMSYRADYQGDANYPAATGACEPLTVTPAPAPRIAIVKNPQTQSVAVGRHGAVHDHGHQRREHRADERDCHRPGRAGCNRNSALIPALASMDPGETVIYRCTKPNVRASFANVATAVGTPPSGPNVTATDRAQIKVTPLKPPAKPNKPKKPKKPSTVTHKKPKVTG